MKKDKIIIRKIRQELVEDKYSNQSLSQILVCPKNIITDVREEMDLDCIMDEMMIEELTDDEWAEKCEHLALVIIKEVNKKIKRLQE